jgi:hypothetical protein
MKTEIPPRRRRQVASRGRTGCQQCKKRHVRCDEGKPVCAKCQEKGGECVYDHIRVFAVKAHGSEVKARFGGSSNLKGSGTSSPSSSTTTSSRESTTVSLIATPSPLPHTSEELHALHVWTTYTAPWVSNYGRSSASGLWTNALPRLAAYYPAIKHIIVAIALLDGGPEGAAQAGSATRRYSRILRHYNAAIGILARNKVVGSLELLFSAVLSWMLEVMGLGAATALIHLNAARTIAHDCSDSLIQDTSTSSEAHDMLAAYLPSAMQLCEGYATILSPYEGQAYLKETEGIDNPLFRALAVRDGRSAIASCDEIVRALDHYFTSIYPKTRSGRDVEEAAEYIYIWKVAIMRFRYFADVSRRVVLLCYLGFALAGSLLTDPDALNEQAERQRRETAMRYVLGRADDILQHETQGSRGRSIAERVAAVLTRVVLDELPERELTQMAWRLMADSAVNAC